MIDIKVGETPKPHVTQEDLEKFEELKYYYDLQSLCKKMDFFYDKNMEYAKGNRILLWIAIILLLIDLIARTANFLIKLAIFS